jgi:hypothetical protein
MWIPDTKSGIFGSLEMGKTALEGAEAGINTLLLKGEKRLRKEDVQRAKNIIKPLEKYLKSIKVGLKEFEAIAS